MEWLCGSAQFRVHFNWFSSEIDRNITTSTVNDIFLPFLDVLEDSIYFGIGDRKLLVAILITLWRRQRKKNCVNRSMVFDLIFEERLKKKRVNDKWETNERTNKQKVNWKHLKKTFHLSHLIEIPAIDNETWNWCLKSCKWNFDREQRIDRWW